MPQMVSLAERKTAAARIIELHPRWSDRVMAVAAGLSPKTGAALRRPATGEILPGAVITDDHPVRGGTIPRAGNFAR